MTPRDKAVKAAADLACHLGLNASENEVRRLHDAIMATYAAAGWKLTPRDATVDMRVAMGSAWRDNQNNCPSHFAWIAGHDAAPSPEKHYER